jgi:WD40 repeat protein
MVKNHSPNERAITPVDPNQQLSLHKSITNRGIELALQIEHQQGIEPHLKPVRYFPGIHTPSRMRISRNGKIVAIAGRAWFSSGNENIIICEVDNGNSYTLSGLEQGLTNLGYMGNGKIWSLAISSTGDLVLAGYDDRDILCWDVKNREIKFRITGSIFLEPVELLVFTYDDLRFKYSSVSGANMYDAQSGKYLRRPIFMGYTHTMAYSNDGQILVLVKEKNRLIQLIEDKSKQEILSFNNSTSIKAVSIFPDKKKLITIDENGNISLWNAQIGNEYMHWCHGETQAEVNIKCSEEQLEYLLYDTSVPNKNKMALVCPNKSIAVSPDGQKILSGAGKYMRLWNLDGQQICEYPHKTNVIQVAFLPEGQHAVSGCWDGSVYLWRLPQKSDRR